MEQKYDAIIAGAGVAGVFAAVQLLEKRPDSKIAILERESTPGGRIRSSARAQNRWSWGLDRISTELYDYWNRLLKADPDGEDLPTFVTGKVNEIGILGGGKLAIVPIKEAFGIEGAKAIAGAAAVRDWKNIDAIFDLPEDSKKREQNLATIWQGNRKSPSALVLEYLSSYWGITDLWKTNVNCLIEKAHLYHQQDQYIGRWEAALSHLLERPSIKAGINLIAECRIMSCSHQENEWFIVSEKGTFQSEKLLVAQSPWDALAWLPTDYIPSDLLSIASKTKPTSVVVLSETVVGEHPFPEVILIPSEQVQIVTSPTGEICFQATLDYELTLQAPDVVKAIKRLRRSRKKLLGLYPEVKTEGDHLALLPVGWSYSANQNDRRWSNKLSQRNYNNNSSLIFCGDSYGNNMNGDQNLIDSITSAMEAI